MGMLDRFADIIKANINDLLDKCEDPAKMIDQYLAEGPDAVKRGVAVCYDCRNHSQEFAR